MWTIARLLVAIQLGSVADPARLPPDPGLIRLEVLWDRSRNGVQKDIGREKKTSFGTQVDTGIRIGIRTTRRDIEA